MIDSTRIRPLPSYRREALVVLVAALNYKFLFANATSHTYSNNINANSTQERTCERKTERTYEHSAVCDRGGNDSVNGVNSN